MYVEREGGGGGRRGEGEREREGFECVCVECVCVCMCVCWCVAPPSCIVFSTLTPTPYAHLYTTMYTPDNPPHAVHPPHPPYPHHTTHDGCRQIGFRHVELVRKPLDAKNPDAGETFYFKINGVPVFCKGVWVVRVATVCGLLCCKGVWFVCVGVPCCVIGSVCATWWMQRWWIHVWLICSAPSYTNTCIHTHSSPSSHIPHLSHSPSTHSSHIPPPPTLLTFPLLLHFLRFPHQVQMSYPPASSTLSPLTMPSETL